VKEESSLRVFGNRVLSRIFGPKRDEVPGDYRKLHKKELNIFRVQKSRRLRWAGHVEGGGEACTKFGRET
jgi:hypothetical protein